MRTIVWSRTSWCWMRPSKSCSTPSRIEACETPICSSSKLSKSARRIATPPGKTAARSGASPGSSSRCTRSHAMICLRNLRSASSVMPLVDQPFARRISAIAVIVPELPMPRSQPRLR